MMENSEHDDDFVDVTPSNGTEPMEDPEAAGLEDDEAVHDQLPSVEEAKANMDLEKGDPNKAKSRCRFCFYVCCCLCSTFILLMVLAIVVAQMGGQHRGSKSHAGYPGGQAATLAPGTFEPRFDYVKAYLSAFSDAKDLDRKGSPQRMAAEWIADQDLLHLSMDDETFIERYALAVLYFATNGPSWKINLGFLTERQVCDWFHVGFGSDDKPRFVGAHCQGGNKVQQLFFRKSRCRYHNIIMLSEIKIIVDYWIGG